MTALLALLISSAPAALPADVRRFVARHESCQHWLGEDGYDADRAREIAAAVKASCTHIDYARSRLLKRYAKPSPARRRLLELDLLDH